MGNYDEAKAVIDQFRIDGRLEKIKVNTQGHINSHSTTTA